MKRENINTMVINRMIVFNKTVSFVMYILFRTIAEKKALINIGYFEGLFPPL
jgi:uncharacterized membrane protein (DUF4010 family)